jgi:hypothetical protein
MNIRDLLEFLQILDSYVKHTRLDSDLTDIIVGSGYELKFFTLLVVRLKFLYEQGIDAIKHQEFEALGNGLFSMHLSGKGFNVRILYAFLPDRRPALLLGFHERAGKRKTDYTSYLEPAKQRLLDIKRIEGVLK